LASLLVLLVQQDSTVAKDQQYSVCLTTDKLADFVKKHFRVRRDTIVLQELGKNTNSVAPRVHSTISPQRNHYRYVFHVHLGCIVRMVT